jgi:hypothetical protein
MNIPEGRLHELTDALHLSTGIFSIYISIGLHLGTNKPKLEHMMPLVTRTDRRLQTCSDFLIYGGKLELVNSVLSYL